MIQFRHPLTCILSGASGSGKSTLLINILNKSRDLFDVDFHRILWAYAEKNTIPTILSKLNDEQKRKIKFVKGVPDENELENDEFNRPWLLVLDDLMMESGAAKKIAELYTRGSHHRNLSIFLTSQNLFNQEKYSRTISLNSKYIIHFKSPRDIQQFSSLARQIGSPQLIGVYKDICKQSHGYIVLDLSQDIDDLFRFRSNIVNDSCSVYCNLDSHDQYETLEEFKVYVVHAA